MKCSTCEKIVYEEDVMKWCGVNICPNCHNKITKSWKEFGMRKILTTNLGYK
jgi:acetyl-CoA carboxylase beta subunit